jgi:SAM-dependent methyltransferase
MSEGINRGLAPLKCLLCGGLRQHPVFNEFGIDILRCSDCHHVFSSFAADPHYDEYWGDEVADDNQLYWSKARARMHLDFFRNFVAGRSGRLLDMGCGLGYFLKAMAPYTSWEAHGREISPAAARYAREKLSLPGVICGRLEETDLERNSFDLITMWDVIEHISQPDPLLKSCHSLLKEGGIFFVRAPNIHVQLPRARLLKMLRGMRPDTKYLQARDHPHHYSMSSIRRLLERNGFSHVEFMHLHPIESASADKYRFRKGVKNICFNIARGLAIISRGRLNLDNLFVVARKEPRAQ